MARSLLDRLDYYVILAEAGAGEAEAIVVEELVLAGDGTATGLDSAGWGTAAARVAGDAFTWDVRRIGPGTAWCLDVTVRLGALVPRSGRPARGCASGPGTAGQIRCSPGARRPS
ncbi:hypothetical protein ACIBQX_20210 [Nonomuraea sp. NPDC049714]|uniref:hypothetical protein n=1 Tax=Nonomuraea sp. NPDC049714 TaxID=3364357 RepID=UPI0037BC6BFC